MKHIHSLKHIVLLLIFLVSYTSCTKDDRDKDGQKTAVTVSLKSDSSILNNVFLDINDVQLKVKEDGESSNAWVSLNALNTGTYIRNESELLLVDHFEINPTYIYEIRLVLGDNNFIDINNTLISLAIVENTSSSNLIKREFEGNHIYQIVIHIDMDESIQFNNDVMTLNPKLYTEIRKY